MTLVQARDAHIRPTLDHRRRRYDFGRLLSRKAGLLNLLIGVLALAALAWAAWWLLDWAVLRAVWNSTDGRECRAPGAGACWAVIHARWRVILFGLYPYDDQWRSAIAGLLLIGVGGLSCLSVLHTAMRLSVLWGAGFAAFIILMGGGLLGLSPVPVSNWGGLSLTLFIFASVSIVGMPLAIGLALLRRSHLPLIAGTTGAVIDAVRSVPLLALLFCAGVVLPFGLPDFLVGEKLYRVIAAFAFYFACYQAETIRSGFQAVPAGQDDAAKALGMTYLQRVGYILLPQAFKAVLPPTVNQFVIAFLETSLVVVIGFFDVMASGNAAYGNGNWGIAKIEVYIFVAVIFFAFTFTLSRYGAYLERRSATK